VRNPKRIPSPQHESGDVLVALRGGNTGPPTIHQHHANFATRGNLQLKLKLLVNSTG
jgi:hypothetical protein